MPEASSAGHGVGVEGVGVPVGWDAGHRAVGEPEAAGRVELGRWLWGWVCDFASKPQVLQTVRPKVGPHGRMA